MSPTYNDVDNALRVNSVMPHYLTLSDYNALTTLDFVANQLIDIETIIRTKIRENMFNG